MLKSYLLALLAALLLLAAAPRLAQAQTTPSGGVGIGTTAPDASAALDIVSSSKGLLLPRLTQTQRDAIYFPATGLTIYNTTTGKLNTWNGTYWDASLSDTKQPIQSTAVTFDTPGQYTYTVPAGVTSLLVDASGAGGSFASYSGLGGRVTTTLVVTPGETLTLYVGGMPTFGAAGGFNGGGNGYSYFTTFPTGGGGATDVRRSATVPSTNLADRLVVAGGGGGGSYTINGGNGGGLTGISGQGQTDGEGTQTAGGTGYYGNNATDGSLGRGGSGFAGANPSVNGYGGGGGYYGGGAGIYSGGGGSGYVASSGTSNTTMVTGGGSPGNGSLTLTPNPGLTIVPPAPALDGTNITNVPGTWRVNGSSYYYNNGNVGIGTGTPTEKLEIRDGSLQLTATSGTSQPTSVGISNNSGSLNLALAASNGQYADLAQAGDAVLRTNGKRLILAGRDGGSVLVSTGPAGSEAERLRVSTAGNVGIGTAADASQKLEVAGNVKITGTGNGLVFPDGTTQTTASTSANLTGDVTSSGLTTTYANVVPAAKGGAGAVSGLLKANGSGLVSAAVAGTDYLTPAGAGTSFIQNTTTQQANAAFNVSGAGTVGGLLTAGSATVSGNAVVTGTLGLGTTAVAPATQKLDVRGNVRLGADGGNVAGTGQAIEFVGPGFSTDPVGLYRVNPAADASELRVVVGDVADANDKFVVGRMPGTNAEGGIPTGSFTPTFAVSSTGQVSVPALAGTGTRALGTDASGNLTTAAVPGDNLGSHLATQNLDLATNALVGNGGSTGLSITSGGSAQLPAAGAYAYAAPKAYAVTYGISDMEMEDQGANNYKYRVTDSNGSEYVYSNRALRIPVRLPQGATITTIKAYARDFDASYAVEVFFISVLPTDTGVGAPTYNDVKRSSGSPGFTTFSFTPASPVIDNSRAYYLLINVPVANTTIAAIRLSYTVTQAE